MVQCLGYSDNTGECRINIFTTKTLAILVRKSNNHPPGVSNYSITEGPGHCPGIGSHKSYIEAFDLMVLVLVTR